MLEFNAYSDWVLKIAISIGDTWIIMTYIKYYKCIDFSVLFETKTFIV